MQPAKKIVTLTSGNTQNEATAADKIGGGIMTMLKRTAQAARETADRAVRASQKATEQLEQSQERVRRLEIDLKHFQERAQRAENWLVRIRKEVEEDFDRFQAEQASAASSPRSAWGE